MRQHRASPLPGHTVTLGAALLAGVVGCSNNPPPDPGGTFTATSATGASTSFLTPLDTVPSGDGSIFYFTAQGQNGLGVFKVASTGGPVTELFSGSPLVSPLGIALSSDDQTLYIADSAAGLDPTMPESVALGQIFSMPTSGGTPRPVSGSAGTRARGITVVHQGGSDTLYFTGNDPTSLAPALLTLNPGGGSLTTKASGAPLNDPGGVDVSTAGDAYIADTVGGVQGSRSNLIKITAAGSASVLLGDIVVGYPAGVALTRSENILLVSGRDRDANTDVVYKVSVSAPTSYTALNMGIGSNTDSGGLHRARNADIFSWADLTAGSAGTVYRIEFK